VHIFIADDFKVIVTELLLNMSVLNIERKKAAFGNICIIMHTWHMKKSYFIV